MVDLAYSLAAHRIGLSPYSGKIPKSVLTGLRVASILLSPIDVTA